MKDSAPDIKALTVLWVKILEFNVVSFKKKDLHRILLVQGSNNVGLIQDRMVSDVISGNIR